MEERNINELLLLLPCSRAIICFRDDPFSGIKIGDAMP